MRFAAIALSVGLVSVLGADALAQAAPRLDEGKVTRRLKVRKADPALIMLLLGGSQSTQVPPELSTWQRLGNGGFGGTGFAGSGSGQFNGRSGGNRDGFLRGPGTGSQSGSGPGGGTGSGG